MDKITIGDKEYYIAKPVFIILDSLKTETGIDFAMGMDADKSKQAMADMKKLPKVISFITCDTEDEGFDEKKAKVREEYFYRNSDMNDFVRVMGFFSQKLKGSEAGSSVQSAPKVKSKMKLVKK